MSHPAQTTVPHGADEVVAVLGGIAQAYLGRSFNVPPRWNYAAAILLPVVSFFTDWDIFSRFWRSFGASDAQAWISAAVLMWSLCLLVVAAVAFLLKSVRSNAPKPGPVDSKRLFLQASAAAVCAAPAAAFGFGIITRKDFRINEVELKFPNLPNELHQLRILQLSDIHMGAFFSPADLTRVVDASNCLRPDIAFITGDLITTKYDPLDRCLLELRRLRTASGIWGCMGNHEYYSKVEAYTQARARELDMFFLRNEANPLKFGNARLNLVGIDYRNHRPYLNTVQDLVDRDSFNLLLAHTPEVFREAAKCGFDLTLSGHTHGGQINLELMGTNLNIADVHTPYTKGFYQLGASSIYVNSGLGTIGIPVRLGAPPEITLLRLSRA